VQRPRTLATLLPWAADRYGDGEALWCEGRGWSFVELNEAAQRFERFLSASGVAAGDRVSLWAPNSAGWVIAYYGALRAGAVINPLNFLLTADEVGYAVRDCEARCLIVGAAKATDALRLVGNGRLEHLVTIGEAPGFVSLENAVNTLAVTSKPAEPDPDATGAILYTSGTTGRPKGAMLSQRALLLNAALTAQMHARCRGETVVTALPLPHVYGAAILNAAVLVGMKLVLHAQFKEAEILASIARHRATLFEGVPTMYHYLLAFPDLDEHELGSLTRCTVGGQTMPLAKMQEAERRLRCPLIELWGMTELGGLGTTHASYAEPCLGSIGVALPHMEVRIAALEKGQADLARGTVGELLIRGPLVMQGYFGNPAATAEAIDEAGWLHTGDLAHQDQQGHIFVVDRRKDMILTAGYNIYPAEIERVIAAHPSVAMVAVCGVPDEIKGEVPKAYIVTRSGASLAVDQIIDHCRSSLAPYKCPRQVAFVADLPKTSTGKIMRRALRSLDQPDSASA
jgi:long-chain acyl-CoA synthetase